MADPRRRAILTMALDERELDRGLNSARRKVRKFGDDTDRSGRGIGRKKSGGGGFGVGTLTGAVSGVVGSATSAVGGFISDTISDLIGFEDGLSRLQIAAGKSNAEMAQMRAQILGISKATGVSQQDILVGAQTYIDLTGDVAGATAAMSSFARIAQASGASVSDVAGAAAALQQSMQMDPADIEAVFGGLIAQGKAGAVSLRDLAGELSAVAPRFAKFGGSGKEGIADLGAALQIARKGFGSASEAATGLEAVMGAMALNADKFGAAGVQIYKTGKDGRKVFRPFVDIIDAIGKSRLVKDPTALTKAFGSKEAQQAFDMLSSNRAELEKIYRAGLEAGVVQQDLDTRFGNSAGKIALAMNAAKISIAEAFTPERIEMFAQALAKAAEWFAKLIGYAERIGSFIGKAGDYVHGIGGGMFEKLSEQRAKEMTGRPREEAKRLIAQASQAPAGSQARRAAEIAAQQLNVTPEGRDWLPPSSDPWAQAGRGPLPARPAGAPSPEQVLAGWMKELQRGMEAAVKEGMANAKIEVKADGSPIAKVVANASINRAPKNR